jgi:antitoxin (DNA-binding transcriptional repressor) of toxin-antitoxin stability system
MALLKEGAAQARASCCPHSMLKGRKMSSDIMPSMAKHIVHISEAEAASNFADVLVRVRAGIEVVIGDEVRLVAVVRPAEPHVRLLSESLRLAKEHASTATLDEDFARDLEAAINSHREPLNPPARD